MARSLSDARELSVQMKTKPEASRESGRVNTRTGPTRVRWVILGLIFLLSMVTYLDRVNISIATRHITSTYGLSDVDMGKVFSAFILAYGLFQVPGGWLADRFGPRSVLTAAVVWWSAFTALTALAADIFPFSLIPPLWSLVFVRFCLGAGEAAAWPTFNRTIANWMAAKDRAFATSVPLAGGGLGAALTPPFIAWLMLTYGWKESFYVCAVLGLFVGMMWFWYVRDIPEQHPHVNGKEVRIIRGDTEPIPQGPVPSPLSGSGPAASPIPWRAILTEVNVWLLFASAMTCGYLVYIYMTWFYVYLVEERGMTLMQGSIYTTGPFIAISVMTPIGGLLCDKAAKRFGKTLGRRLISMGGMSAAAVALFIGIKVSNINLAIIGLSLGAGGIYFALSSHWATTIDIAKEHAGTVSGFMNWGGNMGGMVSPILTPILAREWGWTPALEIAGAIILVGTLLWLFIRPEERVGTRNSLHRRK